MRRAALSFLISILFAGIGLLLIYMIITPFLTMSLESTRVQQMLDTAENAILTAIESAESGTGSTLTTGNIPLAKGYTLILTTPPLAEKCTALGQVYTPTSDEKTKEGLLLVLLHTENGKQALASLTFIPLDTLREANQQVQRVTLDKNAACIKIPRVQGSVRKTRILSYTLRLDQDGTLIISP